MIGFVNKKNAEDYQGSKKIKNNNLSRKFKKHSMDEETRNWSKFIKVKLDDSK